VTELLSLLLNRPTHQVFHLLPPSQIVCTWVNNGAPTFSADVHLYIPVFIPDDFTTYPFGVEDEVRRRSYLDLYLEQKVAQRANRSVAEEEGKPSGIVPRIQEPGASRQSRAGRQNRAKKIIQNQIATENYLSRCNFSKVHEIFRKNKIRWYHYVLNNYDPKETDTEQEKTRKEATKVDTRNIKSTIKKIKRVYKLQTGNVWSQSDISKYEAKELDLHLELEGAETNPHLSWQEIEQELKTNMDQTNDFDELSEQLDKTVRKVLALPRRAAQPPQPAAPAPEPAGEEAEIV
jgi:hypothetical protein